MKGRKCAAVLNYVRIEKDKRRMKGLIAEQLRIKASGRAQRGGRIFFLAVNAALIKKEGLI